MEIPGIASYRNQPTLTNPLGEESQVTGQQTQALSSSETQNTVTASEKTSTSLSNIEVVNQSNETSETGFNPDNPGGSIDITV